MTTTDTAPVVIELPPTATYSRRRVRYTPGNDGYSDQRIGSLSIRMNKHMNRNLDSDPFDTYGLELDSDPLPDGALAAFILRNDVVPKEPERREFYKVTIYPKGVTCNCKAANCKLECKHTASIAALWAGENL